MSVSKKSFFILTFLLVCAEVAFCQNGSNSSEEVITGLTLNASIPELLNVNSFEKGTITSTCICGWNDPKISLSIIAITMAILWVGYKVTIAILWVSYKVLFGKKTPKEPLPSLQ
ncbi:MAG: hypothetical protein LBF13_01625 [Campylobacteraceae bacterium]|nr:hypothetical protein [Campylobacteraceae bacterium]